MVSLLSPMKGKTQPPEKVLNKGVWLSVGGHQNTWQSHLKGLISKWLTGLFTKRHGSRGNTGVKGSVHGSAGSFRGSELGRYRARRIACPWDRASRRQIAPTGFCCGLTAVSLVEVTIARVRASTLGVDARSVFTIHRLYGHTYVYSGCSQRIEMYRLNSAGAWFWMWCVHV